METLPMAATMDSLRNSTDQRCNKRNYVVMLNSAIRPVTRQVTLSAFMADTRS
jgi:hypothetical protein